MHTTFAIWVIHRYDSVHRRDRRPLEKRSRIAGRLHRVQTVWGSDYILNKQQLDRECPDCCFNSRKESISLGQTHTALGVGE